MVSFISLFVIIRVVVSDPRISFEYAASVANAAYVNPNGIKTFLANSVRTFSLMVNKLSSMN